MRRLRLQPISAVVCVPFIQPRSSPSPDKISNKEFFMYTDAQLEKEAAIFKALGHVSRLRMIKALADGARCVCELQTLVGSDLSTVSKHLSILKNAGLVKTEKLGNNVYYELLYPCIRSLLTCLDSSKTSHSCACRTTQKQNTSPTD